MKTAITSTGPDLDAHVDPRFGRCAYFLIVDTDSMEFEAIENPNLALGGGAGVQSAQMMADRGVESVLTGNCGPNAFQVFDAAGIQVVVGVSGSIHDAVNDYKEGSLEVAAEPNVGRHFGMGSQGPVAASGRRGGGMGRGTGGGRAMGGGKGGGGRGGGGMGRR